MGNLSLEALPAAHRWSATYIALFIVVQVALTILVVRGRWRARVSIGDGGDKHLLKAMRVHGNYVENAPFALAALVVLPMLEVPSLAIHLVALPVLAGRLLHAWGILGTLGPSFGRGAGMILTWLGLLLAAGLLLAQAWS